MRFSALIGLWALASSAVASPPPPPPGFLREAAALLTADVNPAGTDRFAALFADDVAAYLNGDLIARGKPAWVKLERSRIGRYHRRLRGYSIGSLPSPGSNGDLLIVDELDPAVPADMIADPRWTTRATLYQFGPDHRVHSIRIVQADGFIQVPSGR